MVNCEICGAPAEAPAQALLPIMRRRCQRCGDYELDLSEGWIAATQPRETLLLSGWVREQNDAGAVPRFNLQIQNRVKSMRMPSYRERAERLLSRLARLYPSLRVPTFYEQFAKSAELQAISYSADINELMTLMTILRDEKCIDERGGSTVFLLTPKGLLEAERLSGRRSSSDQGFVAMSFSDGLNDAWTNGFDPGIRAAGFHPIRIDQKEYLGGITDQIMSDIRQSRFVVADYTDQRGGVYFEAGFALGLGLPVIPTVREDEAEKLHFDIRHLNTLVWKLPADLATSLERRIRAVIGVGPNSAA